MIDHIQVSRSPNKVTNLILLSSCYHVLPPGSTEKVQDPGEKEGCSVQPCYQIHREKGTLFTLELRLFSSSQPHAGRPPFAIPLTLDPGTPTELPPTFQNLSYHVFQGGEVLDPTVEDHVEGLCREYTFPRRIISTYASPTSGSSPTE